jgi:hypothetical protein
LEAIQGKIYQFKIKNEKLKMGAKDLTTEGHGLIQRVDNKRQSERRTPREKRRQPQR